MLLEIIKTGVTHNGKDVPVGEQRETDAVSGKSLIADGYAREIVKTVAENAFKSPTINSNPSGDKLPAEEGSRQTDANDANDTGTNEGTGTGTEDGKNTDGSNNTGNQDPNAAAKQVEEELTKIRKTLNGQYKRDELYDAAIKVGVEIAYDAKKADIVEAVIAQGKAASLLK